MQGGPTRGSKVFNTIIQMEADHLRENPQTPQQQETFPLFLTPAGECRLFTAELVVCVGPGRFCVCLLSDETQIWLGGFAGRRVSSVVGVCWFWLFPLCDGCSFYYFYFCQNRASGNIGRTGGKKKQQQETLPAII